MEKVDSGAIQTFLASTALFRDCPDNVIEQVAKHAQTKHFNSGDVMVEAGTIVSTIGFIYAGKAKTRLPSNDGGRDTGSLDLGSPFGEEGVLASGSHVFEIVAQEKLTAICFEKRVFDQVYAKVPTFAQNLSRVLSSHITKLSFFAKRGGGTIAAPTPDSTDDGLLTLADGTLPPTAALKSDVMPFVQVTEYDLTPELLQMLPPKVIKECRVLPLQMQGRTLLLGMVDPFSQLALTQVKRLVTSADISPVAISLDEYNATVVREKIGSVTQLTGQQQDKIDPRTIVFDQADSEREADAKVRVLGEEVVQLANAVIAGGIERGASDIHVDSDRTEVRVRYRVSGSLLNWDRLVPSSLGKGLVARLKVLSGLDVTQNRIPQDGRIGLRVDNRDIDLRMSTMPSAGGEKVVMRLFEAANMMRPLEHIFIDRGFLANLREVLNQPYGAIFIAGPTGSGKSSTLYACINDRLKGRPDTNAIMVEDPIEYRLGGVTQVQINHAVNFGFSGALRAILRQDPDLIMVGEIRDPETATIALEAGMTGHLLLSSLHANTAISALQRLENLGASRPLMAQSLSLIVIQRLLRKLCSQCVVMETAPPLLVEALARRGLAEEGAKVELPQAKGCLACGQSGFSGRVPVFETFMLNGEIRSALMADASLSEIESIAEASKCLVPFRRYVAAAMKRKLITPADALTAVAG